MAKKGQKFNKINLETKLEICRKHFEEYVPETPLAKEYDLPIGTIPSTSLLTLKHPSPSST